MQLQLSRMVYSCVVLTGFAVWAPLHLVAADETVTWGPESDLIGPDSETAPTAVAAGKEILVYDWNKPIPSFKGRYVEGRTNWQPDNQPVRNNFDWTKAPNFAKGTYYVRVTIKKMRTNDTFRMIFNHWQFINGKLAETSMQPNHLRFAYRGAPITRQFAFPVKNLLSNHTWDSSHFAPFSWAVKRDLVGFFFPNVPNSPPDNKIATNAFPVEMRFTIVNVAPAAAFSGWQNYP